MTKQQFEKIANWQKETFGQATAMSKMSHLAKELIELAEDLKTNAPERRLEFADCFLLLFGCAASDGMTYEDICKCIDEKHEINLKRKWGQPDENGVVSHIKE